MIHDKRYNLQNTYLDHHQSSPSRVYSDEHKIMSNLVNC